MGITELILEKFQEMDKKLGTIHEDVNKTNTEVKLVQQSVKDGAFPEIRKLRTTLHGDDGMGGLVVKVEGNSQQIKTVFTNMTNHISGHWKFLGTTLTVCSIILIIVGYFVVK